MTVDATQRPSPFGRCDLENQTPKQPPGGGPPFNGEQTGAVRAVSGDPAQGGGRVGRSSDDARQASSCASGDVVAGGAEFAEDVGDVVFDGAGGQGEAAGDVLVGGAGGEEVGDFLFAGES